MEKGHHRKVLEKNQKGEEGNKVLRLRNKVIVFQDNHKKDEQPRG